MQTTSRPSLPLIVDLDGTLVRTDTLHESALRALRDKPLDVLRIPYWLSRGKAVLKRRLAWLTPFDAASLPYNVELLTWLEQQRAGGRPLVLCTASDHAIATAVSNHLGLFDDVIASNGTTNLAGRRKAEALSSRYGDRGFDYAGNSQADVDVWQHARRAIVVNASGATRRKAAETCDVEQSFPPHPIGLRVARRVLRVHQWLKNALLFVPLLAAHELADARAWMQLVVAFVAFSLCASSVYIANDLFDLESDRAHPRKRLRPFASGAVPVWMGVVAAPLLVVAAFVLASIVSPAFVGWLAGYFGLTSAYSWGLKRKVLVDCLTLAVLYTLRIIAGAAAAGFSLSFWLLAFAVFLFLSLAFVKRYAELKVQTLGGHEKIAGRGYFTSDAPLVQALGIASGYSSALVMALYLNSEAVLRLYRTPEVVWGTVPIVIYWISRMWLQAHRGLMHDDPLVYAVKDRASLAAGALFAAVLMVGSIGWPW